MQMTYDLYSREELLTEVNRLTHELEQLKRMLFGSKKERFVAIENTAQLCLPLEDIKAEAEPIIPEKQTIIYNRQKAETKEALPKARKLLPAHLPRKEVIIEPKGLMEGMKKIGEAVTEELDYQPGKLFVRRFIRPKYILPKEDNTKILIASLPNRVIDKSMAGPGLLTQILIDKYVDHLPCYRQIQRYQRDAGVTLPSSTINAWIIKACQLLKPLFEVHKSYVLSQTYLQADETPIKVLDRNKKANIHRGYHWAYYAPKLHLALFDYQKGRGREGPIQCLKDFHGVLQVDGYEVYDIFKGKQGIKVAHCMAHARRYFEQALINDAHRAEYALLKIQDLYKTERKAREQQYCSDKRLELRIEKAIPLLNELEEWMIEEYPKVLPKSAIGRAISYSLKRWKHLSLYATNGELEIDNNLIENSIRPIALGRKNYLFAGSHPGAERAAMLYSFFGTCLKLKINPQQWLREVLTTIADHPVNRLEELLPHQWKTKNPC
jgi:transposase